MKLRILGAAGEVTGSNYMIETAGYKVLVDCGTHQGADEERHEGESFPYDPTGIDAVLLTHAHIDHSGRIPLLVKLGFKGKIYCTHATAELVEVLLRDSARIMKEDAEWRTRKNARKGLPPVEPLYSERDVEDALAYRSPIPYDEVVEILPGLGVRFREAGHILGSAIIETWISEEGMEKPVKVVFSGDLGPLDGVIEKPPAVVEEADFVLIESTYGDRLHKSLEDTRAEFQQAMEAAVRAGGKVLIPTFVVDRAQRMLYEFKLLQKKLPDLKMANIYLDSPMGVKTTEIYSEHETLLSRELKEMLASGDDPFEPRGFSFIRTAEESRAINAMDDGIVLAGSGMCSGGRIMHHLKHSLYKKTRTYSSSATSLRHAGPPHRRRREDGAHSGRGNLRQGAAPHAQRLLRARRPRRPSEVGVALHEKGALRRRPRRTEVGGVARARPARRGILDAHTGDRRRDRPHGSGSGEGRDAGNLEAHTRQDRFQPEGRRERAEPHIGAHRRDEGDTDKERRAVPQHHAAAHIRAHPA